jgi:hypothetical protein
MSVSVLYLTAARTTGSRDGRSAVLDGTFEVSLSAPKELGGASGDGANPEKLFAARYDASTLNRADASRPAAANARRWRGKTVLGLSASARRRQSERPASPGQRLAVQTILTTAFVL